MRPRGRFGPLPSTCWVDRRCRHSLRNAYDGRISIQQEKEHSGLPLCKVLVWVFGKSRFCGFPDCQGRISLRWQPLQLATWTGFDMAPRQGNPADRCLYRIGINRDAATAHDRTRGRERAFAGRTTCLGHTRLQYISNCWIMAW